jgi:flagellin
LARTAKNNLEKEKKNMALNDISLTAGMRSNLLSLQGTVDLLNRTQERLSTGKKVNSPLDNPTNYFVAKALMDRAADISTAKDEMSEGLQTIKTADAGIKAITELIGSAKGIAQTAKSADASEIAALENQYNEILNQIDNVTDDAYYKGVNLLDSDSLSIDLGEGSTLTVTGFGGTAAGLGISDAGTGGVGAWSTAANITTSVSQLDAASITLRTQAKTLSSNLGIVNTRQDFADTLVNTLTAGADNLTLADMNEEGANMLTLQTRQALGTTALSLSAQAAQSVLRLF